MLPKAQRLSLSDVALVFGTPQKQATFSEYFKIISIPSPCGVDEVRFGCAISKKILPHAVDRNKMRRNIYSTLGTYQDFFKKHYVFVQCIKKPNNTHVLQQDLVVNIEKHKRKIT